MKRYSFIKTNSQGATNWIVKPFAQAQQIARKNLNYSFGLWNHLKKTNQIFYSCQELVNGNWQFVQSNKLLK